jgi:N,N'-diacetylchitobiose phosphorylase
MTRSPTPHGEAFYVRDGACGAGLESCFAQRVRVTLAPGQEIGHAFLLGEAMGGAEIQETAERYRAPGAVAAALAAARGFWSGLASAIQVETPSPAIDLMVNAWLPYRNLGCRIWVRAAFMEGSVPARCRTGGVSL